MGPSGQLLYMGNSLYGTTEFGGLNDRGTVFSLNPNGSGFQTLHRFASREGQGPRSGLTQVGSTLYGTTAYLGPNNGGTVYSINADGSAFRIVRTGTAVFNSAGLLLNETRLYGATHDGGASNRGQLFSMNLDGSGFTSLHSFTPAIDGWVPHAKLTLVGSTLYGTALAGGVYGDYGTLYSMNLDGSDFKLLHSFNGTDGSYPSGELILVGSKLYGTASMGGGNGRNGVVFSLNLDGSNFNTIHSFIPATDGGFPRAGLTLVGSRLYGTADSGGHPQANGGTLFSMALDGSDFRVEHVFRFGPDGGHPTAGLTAVGSTLYGVTVDGGTSGSGTVFSLVVPEPGSILSTLIALVALVSIASRNQVDNLRLRMRTR